MKQNLIGPVGILGFGVEGKSTLNYLLRNGIKDIVVMDKNPVELPELPSDAKVQTFIRLMNERGYGVDWQDSHKYITYTDLAREQAGEKACKIRDNYVIGLHVLLPV